MKYWKVTCSSYWSCSVSSNSTCWNLLKCSDRSLFFLRAALISSKNLVESAVNSKSNIAGSISDYCPL